MIDYSPSPVHPRWRFNGTNELRRDGCAVYKYTLCERGNVAVDMPGTALVLSVADQCGAIQLWAEVALKDPTRVRRTFQVLYTGVDLVPENGRYIGTVLSPGGNIVRHIYEVTP